MRPPKDASLHAWSTTVLFVKLVLTNIVLLAILDSILMLARQYALNAPSQTALHVHPRFALLVKVDIDYHRMDNHAKL